MLIGGNIMNTSQIKTKQLVLQPFKNEDGANIGNIELINILRMDFNWAIRFTINSFDKVTERKVLRHQPNYFFMN